MLSGMDIAQVRAAARELAQEASDIQAMLQSLTGQLEAAPWSGNDRQRFVDEWRHRHVAALRRVEQSLRDASSNAMEYARRQEAASRA
jgi:uncharacterized protein YukE